jgi:hypothetical protein
MKKRIVNIVLASAISLLCPCASNTQDRVAAAALAGFWGFIPWSTVALAKPQETTESSPPAPSYPEQPLPNNGEIKASNANERIAPFEIRASKGSHYLVKLADYVSHAAVMTVFVRDGSTIRINVPLGTYEMKYAAGRKWYGYEHLFGPTTVCKRADAKLDFIRDGNSVSGYSVTLYTVPNGNLEMSLIDPSEF